MKKLLLIFFLPLQVMAQTIHFEEDNILYKNEVSLAGLPVQEVFSRLEPALVSAWGKGPVSVSSFPGQNKVVAVGAFPLNTPFHLIRQVHFTIQLTAKDNAFQYRIDSVFVTERRRGSKPKTKTAKELLEDMEETGAAGEANERLLNEIDLRFQKLLSLIESFVSVQKNNNTAGSSSTNTTL